MDPKRRPPDLIARNENSESYEMPPLHVVGMDAKEGAARSVTRIAGGVVFDTPSDQASTARSTPKGRARAEERAPTSKTYRRRRR